MGESEAIMNLKIHTIFVYISLLLFWSCDPYQNVGINQKTNMDDTKPQFEKQSEGNITIVSNEEYEIYSQLLNKDEGSTPGIRIFIANKTTNGIVKPYSNFDEVFNAVKVFTKFDLPKELTNDYAIKNQNSSQLSDNFSLKNEYQIGDGADFTREKYSVIFGFSRVGFNQKKDLALVYYEYYSGPKTAGGIFVILAKIEGKWKEIKKYTPWLS